MINDGIVHSAMRHVNIFSNAKRHILNRINRKFRNKHQDDIVEKRQENVAVQREIRNLPATQYQVLRDAMVSYKRFFDYNNQVWVYEKMTSYADASCKGYAARQAVQAQLKAEAAQWLTDINISSEKRAETYLVNYAEKRVKYVHSEDCYAFSLTSKKFKYYRRAYEEREIELLVTSRTSSDLYSPEMWGKKHDISIPAPSEWVYFLKTKCAFKPRRMPLLETMRNDLRVYLNQKILQ
jgi:hypothetical protein